MNAQPPRLSVREILQPRSVAVFGASEDRDKFGGRIMHFLVRHGFAGEIVPINPRPREILGRTAYASLADAPMKPEVAILAVPVNHLLPAVEQCAAAGVGCCVIISTGFAEANDAGAALQQRILEIALPVGMRIIGPNCMGLINPLSQLALCSSVVLDTVELLPGRSGLISQSGALMVSLFDRAIAEGIGFSGCVSLGNQSDLEICDFLEYFIDDPATDAICVYIEGLRDPARFVRAAAACRRAGKPMVVVKTGKTSDGVRAARSHTASLAGDYDSFAAICRAHNVVLADDPVMMVRIADLLISVPVPKTDGIGILSGSGGGTGLMVDRVVGAGFPLARLSPSVRGELGTLLLPPQADNPIDLGGRLPSQPDDIAAPAMRVLASAPEVGLVLLLPHIDAVFLGTCPHAGTDRARVRQACPRRAAAGTRGGWPTRDPARTRRSRISSRPTTCCRRCAACSIIAPDWPRSRRRRNVPPICQRNRRPWTMCRRFLPPTA